MAAAFPITLLLSGGICEMFSDTGNGSRFSAFMLNISQ